MARAKTTIDHDTIKSWVEERGGCPAQVKGTGTKNDPGILRIDYSGFSGQRSLQEISWKAFFRAFEGNGLALLYQEEGDSRFSKLVAREGQQAEGSSRSGSPRRKAAPGGRSSPRNKAASRNRKRGNGVSADTPDAIELLTEQHREVEGLFDQIKSAKSASQKQRLFGKLANALAAHAKIEETLFYPAAFGEETESELRESVEEHLVVKRLVNDLMKMNAADPQYMSKLTVLEEAIEHHVKEEEGTLFPSVREHSEDDLKVLGAQMQRRYRQLMKEKPSRRIPKEVRSAAVAFG